MDSTTQPPGGWRLGALELPEDRQLAGRVAGLLYLAGALSALFMLLVPQGPQRLPGLAAALAATGAAWGVACITVVPWPRAPRWVSHLSSSAGFLITGVLVALLGGAGSPARFLLLFIAFYAAYFYPPRTAAAYLLGCSLVYALPLLYDPSGAFAAEMAVMLPTFVLLGGAVAIGKRRLVELRGAAEAAEERHRELAAEQAALRRVATVVASGRTPDEVYGLVAREAAELLGAMGAGVLRFESAERLVVLGAHDPIAGVAYEVGAVLPVEPGSDIEELRATGEAVLLARTAPGSTARRIGYGTTVVAPVHVGDDLWGVLAVAAGEPGSFGPATVDRLSHFASLLATSVRNTEDRHLLTTMASTDPLTGLANHRTFHERLGMEVARAQRHGRPLALVVLDIDQFKEINDSAGHGAGDRVLAAVADGLRQAARAEDVLARIGGDEFALLLPETTSLQALGVVERARASLAAGTVAGHRLTASAGVSDLTQATTADALFKFADGALYWSKAKGRDCAWVYDPAVVHELSAEERAEHLERFQALNALRALARAIDAKDPLTRRHSQRVASLCHQMAELRGWPPDRVQLLTEAALVHDVGKIGIPDAILLKQGRLTPAEFEEVKRHAVLGAQIVQEVLTEEQAAWIRGHHERPDGQGYPDGVTAGRITEGTALLALADAFDVMTVSRPYSPPRSVADALAECRRLTGRQFLEEAVACLEELAARGALDRAGAEPAAA